MASEKNINIFSAEQQLFLSKILSSKETQSSSELRQQIQDIDPEFTIAMDIFKAFHTKHNLIYNEKDLEQIDAINKIIGGDIEDTYDDGCLANCAALYCQYELSDIKSARYYFLMAIEKGDDDAISNLAQMYEEQNKPESAKKYYKMASEKGCLISSYNLAQIHEKEDNFNLAIKYYKIAIEGGDSDAMYALADLYTKQAKYGLAKKYYRMAISKGDSDAMSNLGFMYLDELKFGLAQKYLKMAVEKGNVYGMLNLADLYHQQNKVKLSNKYYAIAEENKEYEDQYEDQDEA